MNTVLLNTVNLDDGRIIKKGGSGGGGNTPGGGGGSDIPVIGDGKTYLYIKIAEKGRMNVPLYFSQTVANGVTIDWGDGSATQTLSGTGYKNTTHEYKDVGEYTISLNPADGCILRLGGRIEGAPYHCVLGSFDDGQEVYRNMLQAVEIGKNVENIGNRSFASCCSLSKIIISEGVKSYEKKGSIIYYSEYTFSKCYSLSNIVVSHGLIELSNRMFNECRSLSRVVIQKGIKKIGDGVFYYCDALQSVEIPNSVTSIGQQAFYRNPLTSIKIPESVTSIASYAFYECKSMAIYDFSQCTSIPTLGSYAFSGIPSDCKIVVPDALYDEWIAATNWSSYASYIIKASEFNA